MIAAAVQRDVDGIPKGTHDLSVPRVGQSCKEIFVRRVPRLSIMIFMMQTQALQPISSSGLESMVRSVVAAVAVGAPL